PAVAGRAPRRACSVRRVVARDGAREPVVFLAIRVGFWPILLVAARCSRMCTLGTPAGRRGGLLAQADWAVTANRACRRPPRAASAAGRTGQPRKEQSGHAAAGRATAFARPAHPVRPAQPAPQRLPPLLHD